jgi:DNA-binding NtrC family response regulator
MSGRNRLLVVDDDANICHACRRVLSGQGFLVEESTDSRVGLRRAVESDYAAILLDVKMPEMDGIQFLEELRKTKPALPVLIMTGYPSVPNAVAAVRLGASNYITKPFTPGEITRSVQRVLARRKTNGKRMPAPAVVAVGPLDPSAPFEGEGE